MKSLALLLVAALALALSASAEVPTSGFFYGNPTNGAIQFAASTGEQTQFVNTFVSRPLAIAYDSTSDQVLFSNTAPGSRPWVASASAKADSPAEVAFSPAPKAPRSTVAQSIQVDASKNSMFVLYSDNRPSDRLKFNINTAFPAIQSISLDGQETVVDVLNVNNGTQLPTSIALDTAGELVYLSVNGMSSVLHGTRSGGGIYKVGYAGDGFGLVHEIPALSEPSNFVTSVQYAASANALYYILHAGNATEIHRYALGSAEDTVVYDGSVFTPAQLVVVDEGDSVTLWVRNAVGDFYQCANENCDSLVEPTFSVPNGAAITDFDIDAVSNTFFAVGPRIPGVIAVRDSSVAGFLVSGVGQDTKIWADTVHNVLHYSGYNRIDSFSLTAEPSWATTAILDTPIDQLTGDATTGLLVVASKTAGTIMAVDPTTHETSEIISAVDAAAIAANGGLLYFARAASQGGEYTIESCTIADCQPALVLGGIQEAVTSVTMGASGAIYYATAEGIYEAPELASPVVAAAATISPFSMVLYPEVESPTLFYLDVQDSVVEVASCELAACAATVKGASVPVERGGHQVNAFMTGNSNATTFFWATSSMPRQVFKHDVASKKSIAFLTTDDLIHGLELIENDTKLLVGSGGSVLVYDMGNTHGEVCVNGKNVTVGAFTTAGDSLFWADKNTGNVFQCALDCSDCYDSALVNRGNADCGEWQSLVTMTDVLYEEFGCGGIVRAQEGVPVTHLKSHGKTPFSDLVAGPQGMLAWAVPFRHTIIQSTDSGESLTGTTTLLTGTGTFTELVVDEASPEAMFFWVDPAAQKILYSSAIGGVSDLTLQYAAGFSSYTAVVEEPSATSTATMSPSVSMTATATASVTPSVSPSQSASISVGASESATSSLSASVSVSVSLGISASLSMSSSASPSVSMSMSTTVVTQVNATQSATTTVTPSASASWSIGAVASVTPTTSPSATPEPSLLPGESRSTTPTYSFNPYFVGSATNTPGLAETAKSDGSPLITKTGWEWIGLVTAILILFVLLPCLFFTWRNGVEREMAMSLLLPEDN